MNNGNLETYGNIRVGELASHIQYVAGIPRDAANFIANELDAADISGADGYVTAGMSKDVLSGVINSASRRSIFDANAVDRVYGSLAPLLTDASRDSKYSSPVETVARDLAYFVNYHDSWWKASFAEKTANDLLPIAREIARREARPDGNITKAEYPGKSARDRAIVSLITKRFPDVDRSVAERAVANALLPVDAYEANEPAATAVAQVENKVPVVEAGTPFDQHLLVEMEASSRAFRVVLAGLGKKTDDPELKELALQAARQFRTLLPTLSKWRTEFNAANIERAKQAAVVIVYDVRGLLFQIVNKLPPGSRLAVRMNAEMGRLLSAYVSLLENRPVGDIVQPSGEFVSGLRPLLICRDIVVRVGKNEEGLWRHGWFLGDMGRAVVKEALVAMRNAEQTVVPMAGEAEVEVASAARAGLASSAQSVVRGALASAWSMVMSARVGAASAVAAARGVDWRTFGNVGLGIATFVAVGSYLYFKDDE